MPIKGTQNQCCPSSGGTSLPNHGLTEHTDVNTPAPNDGDVLSWDQNTQQWTHTAPCCDNIALNDLANVVAPDPPGENDILAGKAAGGFETKPLAEAIIEVAAATGDQVFMTNGPGDAIVAKPIDDAIVDTVGGNQGDLFTVDALGGLEPKTIDNILIGAAGAGGEQFFMTNPAGDEIVPVTLDEVLVSQSGGGAEGDLLTIDNAGGLTTTDPTDFIASASAAPAPLVVKGCIESIAGYAGCQESIRMNPVAIGAPFTNTANLYLREITPKRKVFSLERGSGNRLFIEIEIEAGASTPEAFDVPVSNDNIRIKGIGNPTGTTEAGPRDVKFRFWNDWIVATDTGSGPLYDSPFYVTVDDLDGAEELWIKEASIESYQLRTNSGTLPSVSKVSDWIKFSGQGGGNPNGGVLLIGRTPSNSNQVITRMRLGSFSNFGGATFNIYMDNVCTGDLLFDRVPLNWDIRATINPITIDIATTSEMQFIVVATEVPITNFTYAQVTAGEIVAQLLPTGLSGVGFEASYSGTVTDGAGQVSPIECNIWVDGDEPTASQLLQTLPDVDVLTDSALNGNVPLDSNADNQLLYYINGASWHRKHIRDLIGDAQGGAELGDLKDVGVAAVETYTGPEALILHSFDSGSTTQNFGVWGDRTEYGGLTSSPAKYGQSLALTGSGSSSYPSANASDEILPEEAFTFQTWGYWTGFPFSSGPVLALNEPGDSRVYFMMQNGASVLRGGATGSDTFKAWPSQPPVNQWSHICLTRDAGTSPDSIKYYIDGVLQFGTPGVVDHTLAFPSTGVSKTLAFASDNSLPRYYDDYMLIRNEVLTPPLGGAARLTSPLPTLVNGDHLTYDTGTGKWINQALPAQTLSALTDTNITGITDGQILQYDNGTGKWVNIDKELFPHSLNDHTDVTVSAAEVYSGPEALIMQSFDSGSLTQNFGTWGPMLPQAQHSISGTSFQYGPGSLAWTLNGGATYPSGGVGILPSEDFTLEFWFNRLTNSPHNLYFADLGGGSVMRITIQSTHIECRGGNPLQNFGRWSHPAGSATWHHLAFVRQGTANGALKLYANGVLQVAFDGLLNANDLEIPSTGVWWQGHGTGGFEYADDIRLIKGTAIVPPVGGPPRHTSLPAGAGAILQFDGAVWRDHPPELTDNIDVTLNTLADGDHLIYNSTTEVWENTPIASGTLLGLSDTNISAPVNDQHLVYNSTSSKWENAVPAASGETNTASNVGTGEAVFKQKTGVDLEFKSLTATSNKIALVTNTDDVGIDLGVVPLNDISDVSVSAAEVYSGPEALIMMSFDTSGTQNLGTQGDAVIPTGQSLDSGIFKYGPNSLEILVNTGMSFPSATVGIDAGEDFTLEFWYYRTTNNPRTWISNTTDSSTLSSTATQFTLGIVRWNLTGFPGNGWVHVCILREGSANNNLRLYINGGLQPNTDGTLTGSSGLTWTIPPTSKWFYGASGSTERVDDIRLIKGTAIIPPVGGPPRHTSLPAGAGAILQFDGAVWRDHPPELTDNIDVTLNTLADGDHLIYNSTTEVWENTPIASGTLLGLSDTNISAPANDQHLVYNSTSSKWENAVPAASGQTNTASNVGTAGVGVFKQKTGVDLEFKNINAGSTKITVADDTGDNEIDIDINEANLTLDNLGGTLGVAKGGTGVVTHATNFLTGNGTSAILSTKAIPTGTVLGTTDAQALTNKTITDTSNNVASKSLHSATTVVDVSAATAPTVGQVLTASSGTAATWTTPTAAGQTNTASNVGTAGVGVFKQKTGVDFEFKNVNAASTKISVADDTGDNEIDIDVNEANLTLDNLGGTLGVAKGGTGVVTHATNFLTGNGTGNVLSTKAIPTGDVIGTTDAQTLTNKTIDATNNTITQSLTQHTDVTLTTPATNNILQVDGTGQWVNKEFPAVNVTAPATDDILQIDGTGQLVNQPIDTVLGSGSVLALGDMCFQPAIVDPYAANVQLLITPPTSLPYVDSSQAVRGITQSGVTLDQDEFMLAPGSLLFDDTSVNTLDTGIVVGTQRFVLEGWFNFMEKDNFGWAIPTTPDPGAYVLLGTADETFQIGLGHDTSTSISSHFYSLYMKTPGFTSYMNVPIPQGWFHLTIARLTVGFQGHAVFFINGRRFDGNAIEVNTSPQNLSTPLTVLCKPPAGGKIRCNSLRFTLGSERDYTNSSNTYNPVPDYGLLYRHPMFSWDATTSCYKQTCMPLAINEERSIARFMLGDTSSLDAPGGRLAQTVEVFSNIQAQYISTPYALFHLDDTQLSTPYAQGSLLQWDGTAGLGDGRWVNAPGVLNTLVDVTITAPSVGNMLTWSGTQWVNYQHTFGQIRFFDLAVPYARSVIVQGTYYPVLPTFTLDTDSLNMTQVVAGSLRNSSGVNLKVKVDYQINVDCASNNRAVSIQLYNNGVPDPSTICNGTTINTGRYQTVSGSTIMTLNNGEDLSLYVTNLDNTDDLGITLASINVVGLMRL